MEEGVRHIAAHAVGRANLPACHEGDTLEPHLRCLDTVTLDQHERETSQRGTTEVLATFIESAGVHDTALVREAQAYGVLVGARMARDTRTDARHLEPLRLQKTINTYAVQVGPPLAPGPPGFDGDCREMDPVLLAAEDPHPELI
jgi:hypothetical protein